MKNKKKVLQLCSLGVIFNLIFTVILQNSLILDLNSKNNEEIYVESPRISYFNNSASPIFINDSNPNFSWERAGNQSWCEYKNGIYYIENLTINARNKSNCITIINSNKIFVIKNCTLYNATEDMAHGAIWLSNVTKGVVRNNTCSNQMIGIGVFGNQNNISGNIFTNNSFMGILILSNGSENIISGNTVNDNFFGIVIFTGGSNNTIPGNNNIISGNALNNNANFSVYIEQCNNTTIAGNTITNTQIGIVIANCNNSMIMGNNFINNSKDGIWLSSSNISEIFENRLINNARGIQVEGKCEYNQIYYNLFQENSKGIQFKMGCNSNNIIRNAFIKNGIHAEDKGIDNQWNSTASGNYWDNHTFLDPDHDGIIDTEFFSIAGTGNFEGDHYPLWQSPIHVGGKIYIDDTSVGAPNWNRTAELTTWCSGKGSFSEPYVIENLEIDANYSGSGIKIQFSSRFARIENCIILNANDSDSDSGILIDNSDNVTIADNICLNNADFGIFFGGGCKNNTILLNFIEGSSTKTGIYLADGCNNNTILNNTITSTGNDTTNTGIFLLEYCYNNTIQDNIVSNNRGMGIQLSRHCSNNTIVGNEVNENDLHGIFLNDRCNNNTISGNTVNENENGILLEGLCNKSTISGNIAIYNRESGIKLMDLCFNNTISGNTAEHNGQNGIHLFYSHNNTISNNGRSFNHNGISGIYLEYSDYNEIISNAARYNEYGIYLSTSHNNIIRDNDFRSNYDFWVQFDGPNENNTFLNNIIADPPGGAPPIDIMTIIVVIIIICSILIAFGGVYAYKRKQKVITVQSKGVPGKKSVDTMRSEQAVGVKKKKQKADDSAPVSLDLTEMEKEELEQTESELGIEKSEFICIVHKGTIDGAVYICPNCKTFYCVRCANALKEKGEKCWSCESEVNVSISDNVLSDNEKKIQELQTRMESIKTTVKTLDESFYSGAISQEIYSQSREPLMKKITSLLEQIEQLKS